REDSAVRQRGAGGGIGRHEADGCRNEARRIPHSPPAARSGTMAAGGRAAPVMRQETRKTMQHSTGRILTTHVGSLPRTGRVLDFLVSREQGEPYDPAAFEAALGEAVDDVVRRQVEVGID